MRSTSKVLFRALGPLMFLSSCCVSRVSVGVWTLQNFPTQSFIWFAACSFMTQSPQKITMTLQWMTVAFFLYSEIAVNLILCVPFLSAQRWRLVFNWRIWSWLSLYCNKCFLAIIMVLIVLFLDAIREVQKYSDAEPMQDANANPNLHDHVHMKLFRAQRNLYICGFSLFLWLVTYRVVTLLTQVAATLEDSAGIQAQAEHAFQAAEKQQEENQKLRKALQEGSKSTSAAEQQLKLEIKIVKSQLRAAQEVVQKSHDEVETMRRQAKGLSQVYDRLLREHHLLQNLHGAEDKKDQ